MPVDHGTQLSFGQARMRRDGLEHLGVGVGGQRVADLGRQVAPFGHQHPPGRVRRGGQFPDLGGRGDGDPRQQGGTDPDGSGQADEHVQRQARVVGEFAPHVVTGIGGQPADQAVVDRGILRESAADAGLRAAGEAFVHLMGQVGAPGQRPAQQRRRMVGEAEHGRGRRGRVSQRLLLHVVERGLVGAVTRGIRWQLAVGLPALRIVDERRLLPVADQAPPRRRHPFAGEQRGQHRGRCRLVGGHRAADLGMRVFREPRRDVRRRPQCELRDDPDVGVGGEGLRHVWWEARAGGQPLPTFDDRIPREQACPLRTAGSLGEQGDRGERLGHRIDVGGRQQPPLREQSGALFDARDQRHRLRTGQVGTPGQACGDVLVGNRDQPFHEIEWQGRILGEAAQDVVHRDILPCRDHSACEFSAAARARPGQPS
ncbi:hypothetical protein [Microbispora sp. GKU 823]|uniref:hypothetical protein n=1 Tax=Microbispora sp. GKU 823 TaxID=1652100 RepID=UPI001C4E2071|nr:hypothetical protein [Microbispora sp. GKU 823]